MNRKSLYILAAFCVAVLGSLSATSKADLVFESTGAVLQANDLSLTLDVHPDGA